MTDVADRALVERFLSHNDDDAFRQLYRRHSPRMYAFALRMCGGRSHDAEDALQEAWLRASRRLREFQWRSALPTWLISIAANCVIEQLRKRSRGGEVELRGEFAAAPVSRDLSLTLDRAIAALPDGYRTVIVMHDVEGFSHAEIGAAMGVTEGTSRSQLFHARRALRAVLSTERS